MRLNLTGMNISLRPYHADDQNFLFKLYAATRQQEISAWGWSGAQQEAFLRMQFNAQQQSYGMTYGDAEHRIVMLDNSPIGRILVQHKSETALLVDIALLPEYRGRGIGGGLLRDLIEHCNKERIAVRLQVLKTNPAQRLYEKLGFRKIGEDELYFQMERAIA